MAWNLVAHTNAASGDTISVTTSSIDTSTADLLIVVVSFFNTLVGHDTLNDNKSNTWFPLTVVNDGSVEASRIYYAKNAIVGSGHTFTWTTDNASSSYPAICVAAFSGSNTSSPFDVENGASALSGTTIQPGTVTPTQHNDLVVTSLTLNAAQSGTPSIDSSFTVTEFKNYSSGVNFASALAYKFKNDATAENPTWTIDTSTNIASAIAMFKISAGFNPNINEPTTVNEILNINLVNAPNVSDSTSLSEPLISNNRLDLSLGNVGNIGTAGTSGTGSTLALVPTTQLNVGNVGIVVACIDNLSTVDGETNEVVSIADNASATNIYNKLGEWCNSNGAGSAGIVTAVFFVKAKVVVAITNTITITFATSAGLRDRVATMWAFSIDPALTIAIASKISNATDAANDFGSVSLTSLINKQYLFFRGLGKEVNSITQINPTTSHTAITAARSRNNSNALSVRGEFLIQVGTADTSNPTLGVIGDTANYFFALQQVNDFLTININEPTTLNEVITTNERSFISIIETTNAGEITPGISIVGGQQLVNSSDTFSLGELVTVIEVDILNILDTILTGEVLNIQVLSAATLTASALDLVATLSELITANLLSYISIIEPITTTEILTIISSDIQLFVEDDIFANSDANRINMIIPFCPVMASDLSTFIDTLIAALSAIGPILIENVTLTESVNLLVFVPIQPNEAYYRRYLNDLSIA